VGRAYGVADLFAVWFAELVADAIQVVEQIALGVHLLSPSVGDGILERIIDNYDLQNNTPWIGKSDNNSNHQN